MNNYSYSYSLYRNDKDESAVQKFELPDDINADGFVRCVKRDSTLSNIGKIRLSRTLNQRTETITVYVDDRVRMPSEVQDMLKTKFHSVCGFNPKIGQNIPAVITGHKILYRTGIVPGHNMRTEKNDIIVIAPKEYTWTEPFAIVKMLNSANHDVLVNRDLKQIWPTPTGALPQIITDFFVNER